MLTKKLPILAFSAISSVAHAQAVVSNYVIYPNQAACLARSAAMCSAMRCDGVKTVYWWDCHTALNPGIIGTVIVTSGAYAMAIQASGLYAATASNAVSGGNQGLSVSEQVSFVTPTAIAAVLPTVSVSVSISLP